MVFWEEKMTTRSGIDIKGLVIERCLKDGHTINADKYWEEETEKALREAEAQGWQAAIEKAENLSVLYHGDLGELTKKIRSLKQELRPICTAVECYCGKHYKPGDSRGD